MAGRWPLADPGPAVAAAMAAPDLAATPVDFTARLTRMLDTARLTRMLDLLMTALRRYS